MGMGRPGSGLGPGLEANFRGHGSTYFIFFRCYGFDGLLVIMGRPNFFIILNHEYYQYF